MRHRIRHITEYTYDAMGRTSEKAMGAKTALYEWAYGGMLAEVDTDFIGEASGGEASGTADAPPARELSVWRTVGSSRIRLQHPLRPLAESPVRGRRS